MNGVCSTTAPAGPLEIPSRLESRERESKRNPLISYSRDKVQCVGGESCCDLQSKVWIISDICKRFPFRFWSSTHLHMGKELLQSERWSNLKSHIELEAIYAPTKKSRKISQRESSKIIKSHAKKQENIESGEALMNYRQNKRVKTKS